MAKVQKESKKVKKNKKSVRIMVPPKTVTTRNSAPPTSETEPQMDKTDGEFEVVTKKKNKKKKIRPCMPNVTSGSETDAPRTRPSYSEVAKAKATPRMGVPMKTRLGSKPLDRTKIEKLKGIIPPKSFILK